MPASRQRLRAYVYLLICTVCWGAAFIAVEPALDYISPYQFLFYRFALAGLLITPLMIPYLKKSQYRAVIWKILGIELIGSVIYMILLYEGLARSTAIETSLLGTTTPLFIILACVLFLRERQTKREWIGLAISFVGMLVIALLPLFNGAVGLARVSVIGSILIIGANCIEAIWAVLSKKHYTKIPMLFAAGISFWFGAVIFGLICFAGAGFSLPHFFSTISHDWQQPSVIIAVVYMAVFSSIIGLTTYLKGQKLIEASEASLFFYLQPLIYLPLGVLILGEPLSIYQLLGLAVILLGVGISETRR